MAKNGDKRSVSTDALETLGTLNLREDEGRDAIHLAVLPIIAPCDLMPGEHVNSDGTPSIVGQGVGIIDPFIVGPVPKGSKCWLVLYPRTINSLRHVWSHPSFSDDVASVDQVAEAEKIVREFCSCPQEGCECPSYEQLIEAAKNGRSADGELEIRGDTMYYGTSGGGAIPKFIWNRIEIITGVDCTDKPMYFTCSC